MIISLLLLLLYPVCADVWNKKIIRNVITVSANDYLRFFVESNFEFPALLRFRSFIDIMERIGSFKFIAKN